jgi:hypothetical protein
MTKNISEALKHAPKKLNKDILGSAVKDWISKNKVKKIKGTMK